MSLAGRSRRNPVVVGVVGLTVLGLAILAAFRAQDLPLIGGGTTYTAQFREAGGLNPSDEVRVAGVRVGQVESLDLAGDRVLVRFRVTDDAVRLGNRTGASIRIKTVLGRKYLSLEPAGPGRLAPDQPIPVSRTVAPYDVIEAVSDLTTTTEKIDTGQLAKALDTLSATFRNSPDDVKASLSGLSRLSRVVAERDAELHELLGRAASVSKVLSDRNAELVRLVKDGDLLLQEVKKRRALIHQILVESQTLSTQVEGLIADNRAQLKPALQRLDSVVRLLRRNQDNLDRSIGLLAPFVRVFANTLGTGPWFDTYIPNLVPLPATPRLPTGQNGSGGQSGSGGQTGGGR